MSEVNAREPHSHMQSTGANECSAVNAHEPHSHMQSTGANECSAVNAHADGRMHALWEGACRCVVSHISPIYTSPPCW